MNSSEITDRESQTERDQRNAKIRISQEIIRADLVANGNLEDPRTKENNAIYPAKTVEEDIKLRQDVVGGQINGHGALLHRSLVIQNLLILLLPQFIKSNHYLCRA